jgi:HEAT repeat protein
MDWHRFFRRFRRSTAQQATPPVRTDPALAKYEMEDRERTSGIVRQLGDPSPGARKQAGEALRALGLEAAIAVPAIVPLFQHSDHNVRRDAIMAVGRMGRPGFAAAPKLIESLGDHDAGVRRMARIAVLQVDPEANALLGALTHSDARIRESAAHALPRVASLEPPPVNTVVAHLADNDPNVRQILIETLVKIGPPTIPALVRSLSDDRIRSASIAVLAGLKEAAAPAIQTLVELTRAHDPKLTIDVVGALSAIGSEATPALVHLLDDEKLDSSFFRRTEFDDLFRSYYGVDLPHRDTVSSKICYALARMGSVSQLVTALKHTRAHVRECAARALGSMDSEATPAVPTLIGALADPNEAVRTEVTAALGAVLPSPEARVDALLAALSDERFQVAADDLGALAGGEDAVAVLLARLKSDSPAVSRAAARAIERILPTLSVVRIPKPWGGPGDAIDYRSVTPDDLSRMLRDRPEAFEFLSHLHSPDRTKNITGPSRRGPEDLPELIAKVKERQTLLAQAEAELATATVAQPEPSTGLEAEPQRYTDLAIYEGSLYPGDDLATETKLSDSQPLVATRSYTLEVAIRLKRTGIDADRDAPRSVTNPRQDKEDLTVYVLARSQWDGIEIEESLAKITWPWNADSEVALFRLHVKPVRGGDMPQGTIEVRLYDRALDLLDIVRVFVTVVPPDAEGRRIPGLPPRHLLWPDKEPGVPHIDPQSPPRLLSIRVAPLNNGYRFEFLFRERNGEVIEIPVVRDIRAGDLDKLLTRVRDFWTELVIKNYSAQLSVTRATFGGYIDRLANLGVEAWLVLFGARHAAQAGASESLGELLVAMEQNEGALVQITYSEPYGDFIFPWSILYPPTKDSSAVDPLRFWGALYQIEQVKAGPKRDALTDEPISVLFALDPGFGNSEAQKELFERYRTAAGGRLRITSPISDQQTLFHELVRDPSAHLLYFYCHGYASTRPGILRPDGVQLLKRQIEAMPADSAERQALETLLTLTAKMGDESWIYVGGSEIKESKLKLQQFFEKRRPIVFLNMCQSADLVPSMSSGLVRVFLDHNASAVVGTESPMTAVFANAFGEAVLNGAFGGEDIGTALWKARRRFLGDDMRNPLGLAYTLYGRATARVGTIPLITAVASSNSNPVITSNS